ncbi:MAG: hypothetical protein NZ878_08725 [SAR324 cluster bacterium]|nr:hypothetical protein [SAR324 cluster bacterium]
MTENAFIKPAGTKLDSFAENQAYSGWSYSMLFWGHDSNNLKKIMRNEFLIQLLAKPFRKFIHHQKFQEEVLKEFPGFSIHH